ncbi:MAG: oxygenase MpaB family protein [Myxococcota bacterium]
MQNLVADLYYTRHHWDFRLGTYLGLLRTMGIRDMVSRLYSDSLLKTQTFNRLKRTRELIATLIVDGLDSPRGREALARIERAHRGVVASNDEYRYVLSVFFLEPLRFNQEFGWRAFRSSDPKLLFDFWMQVGERMHIRDLLPSLADWSRFQADFETEHLGRSEQGQALARASLYEVVRLVIPRGMQEITRQTLLGTMEPRVRETLGLPQAKLPVALTLGTLRLASWFGAGTRVPTMDEAETAR